MKAHIEVDIEELEKEIDALFIEITNYSLLMQEKGYNVDEVMSSEFPFCEVDEEDEHIVRKLFKLNDKWIMRIDFVQEIMKCL